jgi:hypothetical protein
VRIDDQQPPHAMTEEGVQRLLQYRRQGRRRERDGAGDGLKKVLATEGNGGRDEGLRPRRGRGLGDACGDRVRQQEVAHRRLRPVRLGAAHRQQHEGAAGQRRRHLRRGQPGDAERVGRPVHAPRLRPIAAGRRHDRMSSAARDSAWTPSAMQRSSGW